MGEIDAKKGDEDFPRQDGWARPLATTWTHPRRTFRDTLVWRPTHLVLPLAAAWGVDRLLALQITRGAADYMAIPTMLAMVAVIGPLIGIALVWLFGWIWAWSGRLLGGEASPPAVRAAIAWGQAPALFLLALAAIQFAAIGPELLHKSRPGLTGDDGLKAFYYATLFCRNFLSGAIVVRIIIFLAQAHRFSTWRAIGAILLGLAPGFAVLLGFVFLLRAS